jgi:hypothetical protein
VLLFDGESGLRSKKAQNIIADKFNIKVHAEAFYKRNMAERAIREIKLRMAVLLDLEKKPLTQWRNHLEQVLQIINQNKKQYKSVMQMLADFFTKETVNLPQTSDQIYKFNIGDKVSIDAFPNQRRNLGFKYSLNMGKFFYPTPLTLLVTCSLWIGKLQRNVTAIVKSRRAVTRQNIIIPIYTVVIPSLDQV